MKAFSLWYLAVSSPSVYLPLKCQCSNKVRTGAKRLLEPKVLELTEN
jgi:hypothetical protein